MPGSTDTGPRRANTTAGYKDVGTVLLMEGRIGTILIMTTKGKAGSCTKATGIVTTMAGTTTTVTITITNKSNVLLVDGLQFWKSWHGSQVK